MGPYLCNDHGKGAPIIVCPHLSVACAADRALAVVVLTVVFPANMLEMRICSECAAMLATLDGDTMTGRLNELWYPRCHGCFEEWQARHAIEPSSWDVDLSTPPKPPRARWSRWRRR